MQINQKDKKNRENNLLTVVIIETATYIKCSNDSKAKIEETLNKCINSQKVVMWSASNLHSVAKFIIFSPTFFREIIILLFQTNSCNQIVHIVSIKFYIL